MESNKGFYSGGLAEIVQEPTPLTYSFFKDWFTGEKSVGKAMQILHLPFSAFHASVLVLKGGSLFVDILTEEKTLYKTTIFSYKKTSGTHAIPEMKVSLPKLLHPMYLVNTVKIVKAQAEWIAQPDKTLKMARMLEKKIPDIAAGKTIEQIDMVMAEKVWPIVICVGFLAEFYAHLLEKELEKNTKKQQIFAYAHSKISKKDWFFNSYKDMEKVKTNEISFKEFMHIYGLRADKDYELTSPRWYEIEDEIKTRINGIKIRAFPNENSFLPELNKNTLQLLETYIQFQILRSETKRVALTSFHQLRQAILEKTPHKKGLGNLTKEPILQGESIPVEVPITPTKTLPQKPRKIIAHGQGMGVARGKVIGITKHIKNNTVAIPENTIGIFPNASPEFAIQFPKCAALIFLRGGQTSHGAIVAREYGIPALIDHNAEALPDGIFLSIDGGAGTWEKKIDSSQSEIIHP